MTTWVKRLLIANVVMFFLQMTVDWVTGLFILMPAAVAVRPWTLVTYMFLHDTRDFWHIVGNMLGLYFFGPRVELRMGSERFIALYMTAGLSGALLSFLSPGAPILGASGAVLGVTLAYATFWPRDRVYLYGVVPVPVPMLVAFYVMYSLWGMRGGGDGIAHFAHLGGLAGAFLFLRIVGHDAGRSKWKKQVTGGPPPKAIGDWSRVDTSSIHEVNREEVNRILDKINASGIGSLTPQERLFLSNFVPPDDRKPLS